MPVFWNLLNSCCKTKNDNIVLNVKLYFAGLLYKNADFYSLPEDMKTGSRELLLALSWLICRKKILENFIKIELSKSELSQEIDLDFFNKFRSKNTPPTLETALDFMNYILLISGKINDNLKKLNDMRDKTLQQTTKVNFYKIWHKK